VNIAICDVGMGNLRSVERALLRAAAAAPGEVHVEVTRAPERLRAADKVVVPGQGAFRDCATALDGALRETLREVIARGSPYLGICLGLQVLFATSEEAPGCRGLGVFEGSVRRLPDAVDPRTGAPLKIPHIGWNTVETRIDDPLLGESGTHYYFVHSYVVDPVDRSIVATTTEYGAPFVSAIRKDNVFACQFHPEKSQDDGLALLQRFIAV